MDTVQIQLREDFGVILFRARPGAVITLMDIANAMGAYFQTPGFSPSGGGVWDFRGASVEISFDEVGNFSRPLHSNDRYPRNRSRVGILVDSELDRTVLIECKTAAALTTAWKFFDNLEGALRWAGSPVA